MVTLTLCVLSSIAGYILGRHTQVRIDLGLGGCLMDPRPVVLERKTVVRATAIVTVVALLLGISVTVSWLTAARASRDAEQAAKQVASLSQCQSRATEDAITLWESLINAPAGLTQAQRDTRNIGLALDYIESLRRIQEARESDDPAAVCREGK